jgi:hypothetical protein
MEPFPLPKLIIEQGPTPGLEIELAEQTAYQTKRTQWELDRNSAVSKAEGIINTFNTGFSWAFVNKKNSAEYWSRILLDWGIVAGMSFILFVITLGFIYRKDRLK